MGLTPLPLNPTQLLSGRNAVLWAGMGPELCDDPRTASVIFVSAKVVGKRAGYT